jgi:hypothetical protein
MRSEKLNHFLQPLLMQNFAICLLHTNFGSLFIERGIDHALTSSGEAATASRSICFATLHEGHTLPARTINLCSVTQSIVQNFCFAEGIAEAAVVEARPKLVNAVKNMSFKDAKDILLGEQDAAT